VITYTDLGCPLEFVDDGEIGFVVIPDPEAIAEKIDWLYDHNNKAVDIGKAEREKYC
jgi:glycosyltransferase involved in cell wall biosynthesis